MLKFADFLNEIHDSDYGNIPSKLKSEVKKLVKIAHKKGGIVFLYIDDDSVQYVKNQRELSNYFKKNLISDEIVIGMGAGSISQWMRELKFSL